MAGINPPPLEEQIRELRLRIADLERRPVYYPVPCYPNVYPVLGVPWCGTVGYVQSVSSGGGVYGQAQGNSNINSCGNTNAVGS